MNRRLVTLATLGIALWVSGSALAQSSAAKPPMTLTALDYIEIQQLVNRYADAIDYCGNNGYDYADLYTEDGYFAPSMNGKVGTKFQGRERLAAAAGGGVNNCKGKQGIPWDKMSRHTYLNHVITPTADGAKGKVDLLVAGRNGDRNVMEIQGYYEDEYAKTPQGWKFKSRVHNVPSDFRQPRPANAQTNNAAPAAPAAPAPAK
jgi:hypothetical protein